VRLSENTGLDLTRLDDLLGRAYLVGVEIGSEALIIFYIHKHIIPLIKFSYSMKATGVL
jgi:hypothetical protein